MYLSSEHQSTGDLGGMRYPNRLLSKNLPLCTCSYPSYSAYNSLNHRVNFGQFKLCIDIEKNPGPSVYVDATKTINAPYCQGNVTGFRENGGQRCVAMSLCTLIHSKITKVTSVDDMAQIMIFCLSLLARQSMLVLTGLPGMVTVFHQFFHRELVTSITTVYATHRVLHLKHSLH